MIDYKKHWKYKWAELPNESIQNFFLQEVTNYTSLCYYKQEIDVLKISNNYKLCWT